METRDSKKMDLDRHALLKLIKEMENNSEFNKLHEPIKNYDHDMVLRYVKALQNIYFELMATKGRAYGDSWQKRGEAVSIFGNLSRKFDRIQNFTLKAGIFLGNESKHDTLMDLSNYAILWDAFRIIKYLEWLDEKANPTELRWKGYTIKDKCKFRGCNNKTKGYYCIDHAEDDDRDIDDCGTTDWAKETVGKNFLAGKSDNDDKCRTVHIMQCKKCMAKYDLDKSDDQYYNIDGLRNFLIKHHETCQQDFASYKEGRLPNWGLKS